MILTGPLLSKDWRNFATEISTHTNVDSGAAVLVPHCDGSAIWRMVLKRYTNLAAEWFEYGNKFIGIAT